MLLAVLQLGLFYMFSAAFPYDIHMDYKKEILPFVAVSLIVGSTALSPYLFKSLSYSNGTLQPQTGVGIFVFVFYALFCIYSAFNILLHKLRVSIGLKRIQLLLIIAASIINWIIIPITNFILTLTLKTTLFVKLSPFFSLLFASIIGYALAKRRLFDAKTSLRSSTIYVDQYLKNTRQRTYEYYELQTLVYESDSAHVSLNFSGVKSLDKEAVQLLKNLQNYMKKQGKHVYFVGFNKNVFKQLQPNKYK